MAQKLTNYQLQTKIRIIIKELLQATGNKLSEFTLRIDGYEKFYFSYNDRIVKLQKATKESLENMQVFVKSLDDQKINLRSVDRKSEDKLDKCTRLFEDLTISFQKVQENQRNTTNGFEKMTEENNKMKTRFFELQKVVQDVRSQSADRVHRFVQKNVDMYVEIKSLSERLTAQVDALNLAFQQQHRTFQQQTTAFTQQKIINKHNDQTIEAIQNCLAQKATKQQLSETEARLRQIIELKMAQVEKKAINKVESLVNNNQTILKCIKDMEKTTGRMDRLEIEVDENERKLLAKVQEFQKGIFNTMDTLDLTLNKQMADLQRDTTQKHELVMANFQKMKSEQNKAIVMLKAEMEAKMEAEKTNSQSASAALSEQMIKTLQASRRAEMEVVESRISEVNTHLSNRINEISDKVDKSISPIRSRRQSSTGGPVDEQALQKIDQCYDSIKILSTKVDYLETAYGKQLEAYETYKLRTQDKFVYNGCRMEQFEAKCLKILDEDRLLIDKMNQEWNLFRVAVQEKIERISFMVTKIRGDIVIRNELETKELREIMKKIENEQRKTNGLLRAMPAAGECINLLMAIAFDTQYESSRIFLQNLESTNAQRFLTLADGVLYEFKEKRSTRGGLFYRNKQTKKVDLLKANFFSYNEMWDHLLQNDFKQQFDFLPKGFYRSTVQKKLNALKDNIPTINKAPPAFEVDKAQPSTNPSSNKVVTYSEVYEQSQSNDRLKDAARTYNIRQKRSVTHKKMSYTEEAEISSPAKLNSSKKVLKAYD